MRQSSPRERSFRRILSALKDRSVVSGFTHNYYRYPARFSPTFVRTVIEEFTAPGDTILDPFLGGGTTLVEGLALDRKVIGVDINPIAVFVSKVKSTPLNEGQLACSRKFAERYSSRGRAIYKGAASSKKDPRFLNTPWWLRGVINSVLGQIEEIPDVKVRDFLQCGLLKTAQWALDCRAMIPESTTFIAMFRRNVDSMCGEMEAFCRALGERRKSLLTSAPAQRCILHRSTMGLHLEHQIPREWLPVKLVLTSPPYPGVHVLYHRWQVRGRRETPAAYAVIASPDGHAPSYFTLGGRHEAGLERYFGNLRECFSSVAPLMDKRAFLVQLVSVGDQKSLLPRLLTSIEEAGFEPEGFNASCRSGGAWRGVPNRKWYAPDGYACGRELLLLHRPRKQDGFAVRPNLTALPDPCLSSHPSGAGLLG
jgi:DNA modification methylase